MGAQDGLQTIEEGIRSRLGASAEDLIRLMKLLDGMRSSICIIFDVIGDAASYVSWRSQHRSHCHIPRPGPAHVTLPPEIGPVVQ
jgi:hypothetical protein